jgi:hypothetical protein
MVNGHFLVNVFGTADSLVEVGQQFGWLGAALRSSQFEKGLAAYSPFIKSTRLTNIDPGFPKSTVQPLVKLVCQMGFHTEGPTKDKMNTIGNCWHDMFRNPVMVSGYPILRKSIPEVGIEMPLNMMTALVGSQRAIEFDGKIFLKGFSTMLMAIKLTQDILIWHYHYNEEAEKISYLDHKHQDVEAINLLQLETARHVVGWCSDSKHYAGWSNLKTVPHSS